MPKQDLADSMIAFRFQHQRLGTRNPTSFSTRIERCVLGPFGILSQLQILVQKLQTAGPQEEWQHQVLVQQQVEYGSCKGCLAGEFKCVGITSNSYGHRPHRVSPCSYYGWRGRRTGGWISLIGMMIGILISDHQEITWS